MSQKDFAELLVLKQNGERNIREREKEKHSPNSKKLAAIDALKTVIPFKQVKTTNALKSIDLFAGIGGIRLAFQNLGVNCIFSSELDKFSQKTYAANFGELPYGDITKIPAFEIPTHDILMAGFPCQAFSQAGLKKGFQDTRGTLFFDILRILAAHRPRMFLLENVKQLRGHDKGRTLQTILSVLKGEHTKLPDNLSISAQSRKALSEKLDYWVDFKVLRSCNFGVPQNRQRVYIVGFDRNYYGNIDFENSFSWPKPTNIPTSVGQILQSHNEVDEKYTISQRLLEGHKRRKNAYGERKWFRLFSVHSPRFIYKYY